MLREAPAAAQIIDIVAIHGIGAHPDDSWCKNVGTTESPRWVNWLQDEDMLPAVAPNARIMRYGYQSQWFGEGAMRQKASTVAQRLLLALRRKREEYPFRPLLFIAHCFGGLVVLKALLDARQDKNEWPGVSASTTGLIFFGTPFRGAEGMSQVEMLAAARREYEEDEVQPEVLKILEPGNEFLQEVVDQFGKTRGQANKAQVACFYELKSSNVGKIVGKQDRTRFVVSESSGCLDLFDLMSKYSLSRTHFNMNKFGKPTEEDFETVRDVVKKMTGASHELVLARSQYDGKHKIDFSLRGVPVVSQFVRRDAEMRELVHFFLEKPAATSRRRVFVVHGLGGIGKTQLAVEFAREHHRRFSSVIWLDGPSEASLKQSFAGMAQRLPQDELTADGVEMLKHSAIDVDVAVRECFRWLSLTSNFQWLLIFDNVDRDFHNKDDPQAYDVKGYFPHADHGSILITSRLASLQRHGSGLKVGTATTEQARAILENNAGRVVRDADIILERLNGLPLALTQTGSYMRETKMSASTYAKHYDKTWERLMKKQGRFLLEEYGDRNVLTTWTISYEQVWKQSEEAAWLLKLWGFLDCGELWYELVAASLDLSEEMDISRWLLNIAEDELEFADAAGLLSRYSLADAKEDTNSHSMHSVLHKWCGQLAEGDERYGLGCIAAGLVALNAPSRSEADFWRKRKRLLAHATSVCGWIVGERIADEERIIGALIQPGMFHDLGDLLSDEDRLKEAEGMYERALRGSEKTLGAEHTSTLDTVNNLGSLYADQGRLDEAEAMYERALRGYKKAISPDNIPTFIPALNTIWNLTPLFEHQNRVQDARAFYSKALLGYEKVLGTDHLKCQALCNNLAALSKVRDTINASSGRGSVLESAHVRPIAEPSERQKKSTSRHKLLKKLG